ncbi:MAG: ribonuclease D [Myxococcales bacterium]|nr:ribonuclease D [Myxococcales bacterium]
MPTPHAPRYLDTADAVASFVAAIASAPEIALDTEGANFYRFVDRIYLLQLSTRDETAIIDPLAVGPIPSLGALLASPSVEVVIHDADGDLRLIEQDFGWRPTQLFDTRVAAQLLGLPPTGLAGLIERYLGVKLDKKHQRADWSMRPLPKDMLDYAAEDTAHLLALRDRLAEELVAALRWSWAVEEFAVIERAPRKREERPPAFLRFKEARRLYPRQLAILRELVAWREEVARAADRTLFRIAHDDLLVGIARAAPGSRHALSSVKGMTPFVLGRHAKALVDAVARGLAVEEGALPRFPGPPREAKEPDVARLVGLLKGARDVVAAKVGLDPSLLLPRERMEAVARRRPRTLEELAAVPGVRRWHVEVMGEALLVALSGLQG